MRSFSFVVTILQLLICLPLTREVARLAVTEGEKRYVNFAIIYVAVTWDAEDAIPYNLLQTQHLKRREQAPALPYIASIFLYNLT